MRIAVFHNLPSGGAKRHTSEQLRELSQRGHWIEEFAPDTADLSFCSFSAYVNHQHIYVAPKGFSINRRIPFLTPYINAISGITILRQTEGINHDIADAIDQQNFDLVLVKDCKFIGNPYILQYLQTPNIFQCHHGLNFNVQPGDYDIKDNSLIYRMKRVYYKPADYFYQYKFAKDERQNIYNAGRVLTNSEYAHKQIMNTYQVNSYVVYPGVNINTFAPRKIQKADFVLSVGSLTYRKGFRFLIESLNYINPSIRPALVIVSNDIDPHEMEYVQKLAQQRGVKLVIEKITDDNLLVERYNQAIAFVYAPIQEALGMAPLEAMACGTPVVAVGEAGICETMIDGVTGLLVQRDPQEFADSLARLLADENLYKRISKEGADYVHKNWNWEKAVDHLEGHFNALLHS